MTNFASAVCLKAALASKAAYEKMEEKKESFTTLAKLAWAKLKAIVFKVKEIAEDNVAGSSIAVAAVLLALSPVVWTGVGVILLATLPAVGHSLGSNLGGSSTIGQIIDGFIVGFALSITYPLGFMAFSAATLLVVSGVATAYGK
jgi:hypothetical protein